MDIELIELGHKFGISVVEDLHSADFIKNKIPKLPYPFVKKKQILPLMEQGGKIIVAVSDPLDLEGLEEVRLAIGKEVIPRLASLKTIKEGIEICYQQGETSDFFESLKQEETFILNEMEGYDLLDQRADTPVIRMLNSILLEAIAQGASDIHFDPMEHGMGIRYRIDGVLHQKHTPPKEYQSQLVARVKVLSKLDVAEQRLPQDGRLKLKMGARPIDFRVSTIPCVFGERIVLRILDQANVLLGLDKIGMRPEILENFTSLIRASEGIVLVTGPTGSGKTTTLYSALSDLNSPEVNIMTIEDPVEYKLQAMAQIGVNTKIDLTFGAGLRHILRQDPDVIMIGEIRDKETAEIAIQAALTGHLVLSTLHTNDAPSALTRLIDMGIAPYLLTSCVLGVLAQRLVRLLCKFCKEPYTPSEREKKDLQIESDHPTFFCAKGCEYCFGSGYKGRIGIYELMVLTTQMKRQLLHTPDAHQLKILASNLGMKDLRSEGSILVKLGLTSSQEIFRVTRNSYEV